MGKAIRGIFYVIGTCLLLFSSIVVGANFYKDSGVFDKAVVEVKKQPAPNTAEASPSTNKKIIVDTQPVDNEPAKETAAQSTVAQSTVNNDKLVIEVINCTGKKGLAEDTRTMLEAKGFTVSAESGKVQGKSKIILRVKDAAIKSTLKISAVEEQLKPKSRFDVTIIIGSDFNP
jgi:hypothetical protein